jgi:hypothetical protein
MSTIPFTVSAINPYVSLPNMLMYFPKSSRLILNIFKSKNRRHQESHLHENPNTLYNGARTVPFTTQVELEMGSLAIGHERHSTWGNHDFTRDCGP